MAARFELVSFGCRVNQAEGRALEERLLGAGLRAADGAPADLVIINSCAVTAEAARQARQHIRRALRAGARVAVTGCYAHPAAADEALRQIGGIWLLEADKRRLAECVEMSLAGGAVSREPQASAFPFGSRLSAADPSRALLKVQDGCPAACAYCIVRLVRPTPVSLPPEEAVRRAEALVARGYREIVVCGIHLGLYGADLAPRTDLVALLARLLAVPGLGRVRLSSLEPMEASDELLALMASEPERLCPHLHLPLQSGDDAVLARMNRPYGSRDFLAVVGRVRSVLPEPAIATDVLVGFPGETEAAFERTLEVMREARFARVHVFPFSPRPGTPAAGMDDRVPPAVVKDRRARAARLGEELAAAWRAARIGRTARVVVERVGRDGEAEGLSERYDRVRILGPLSENAGRRTIVSVNLCCVNGEGLEGAIR